MQVDGHIQRLDKDLKKFEEELRRGQLFKLRFFHFLGVDLPSFLPRCRVHGM